MRVPPRVGLVVVLCIVVASFAFFTQACGSGRNGSTNGALSGGDAGRGRDGGAGDGAPGSDATLLGGDSAPSLTSPDAAMGFAFPLRRT